MLMRMIVTSDPARGLIRCTVSGTVNLDDAARLLEAVGQAVADAAQKRLLLDLLATVGELPAAQQFDLGLATARLLGGLSRIAVVQHDRRNNGFGALVARNRGLDIKVFAAEGPALEWLTGEAV
jgi:hypothetical protein